MHSTVAMARAKQDTTTQNPERFPRLGFSLFSVFIMNDIMKCVFIGVFCEKSVLSTLISSLQMDFCFMPVVSCEASCA